MSISSIFAAPSYLWNTYLHYLWNYDSNSWVATIAYAFRIWAIFTILPTLALGLLVSNLSHRAPPLGSNTHLYHFFPFPIQDVTSYVIARTLGDPTASTSHKSSFATQPLANSEPQIPNTDTDQTIPAIPVPIPIAVLPPKDETPPSGASTKPSTPARGGCPSTPSLPTFFVDGEGSEDDGAARLAGVGVFSPVASMPGSPVASRRNILEREAEEEAGSGSGSEESGSSASQGVQLRGGLGRKREEAEDHERGGHERDGRSGHERSASDEAGWTNGGGSTSGESSFAMLDREESFEDAGAHIRRRAPGTTSADE